MAFKKIADISKVRRGASPRPIDDPKYFGGNVGWVRISDVSASKKYLRQTTQYVSALGEQNSVRVDKGDLILSICGTIGKPVILDIAACIHDGFVLFYDIKDSSNEYLYYCLQFSEDILKGQGQSGTQANLNTSLVGDLEIFHPPLEEQTQIAAVLSCIDRLIEQTEALIAKQQRIKTGLMQDLLTKGIDEHGNIRTEATHEFKDSPLGRIPKEWKVENLWAISTKMTNGFVGIASPFYTDSLDGIPYLMSNNVRPNKFDLRKLIRVRPEFHARQKKSILSAGDMLTVQSGHIGASCIVTPDIENSNCHALIITRFKSFIVVPSFIALYINSDTGMSRLSDTLLLLRR